MHHIPKGIVKIPESDFTEMLEKLKAPRQPRLHEVISDMEHLYREQFIANRAVPWNSEPSLANG